MSASVSWLRGGVPRDIAPEHAVGVLDAAALPRRVRVAEVGAQAQLALEAVVPGELGAVVQSDGAAGALQQGHGKGDPSSAS